MAAGASRYRTSVIIHVGTDRCRYVCGLVRGRGDLHQCRRAPGEGVVRQRRRATRVRPSYRRATVMQASLAVIGCLAGLWSAWVLGDAWVGFGALLLGAVVPFTLVVILPTNRQLLEPSLDPRDTRATELLTRWGRLHAVRSVLSSIALVLFLVRLAVAGM